MEDRKPVFDASAKFKVGIPSPEGLKSVMVRFPTDEEWIDRSRRKQIITKQVPEGTETRALGCEEIDAELIAKIRLDTDGPEIDEYDAEYVIEQLSGFGLKDCALEGALYRVTLEVPGATTVHRLQMPSTRDMKLYRNTIGRNIDLGMGKQRTIINLSAAGDLYKKLSKETDGYAGAVPVVHQSAVVAAVMDAVGEKKLGLGAADPGDFPIPSGPTTPASDT